MFGQSQDFERYAQVKPFNLSVADTWQAVLEETIARTQRAPSELDLLDYGCGDGKYFPYWCQRGLNPCRIHGLDVSKIRIERCHSLGFQNAAVLEPGQPLPYANDSFDMVNCMEVIEHIPANEGKKAVAEISRVLRPGGFLLISTPNYPIKRFYDMFDACFHGKWSRVRDDPTHVTYFNHDRLRGLLAPYFSEIEERIFKTGFLYRKWPKPHLLHKLFFVCRV
jgi:SAM-dependent methyltransferase